MRIFHVLIDNCYFHNLILQHMNYDVSSVSIISVISFKQQQQTSNNNKNKKLKLLYGFCFCGVIIADDTDYKDDSSDEIELRKNISVLLKI